MSELHESNTEHNHFDTPMWRKCLLVFITSWMTLAATFSSTSLFIAADEIASDFSVATSEINLANGGCLLTMGLSSFFWVPIENVSFWLFNKIYVARV